MLALRFVAALAVAVWLGGAVAIASVVAPSAFAVLSTHDAATMVGETLRRFHLVSYGAGAVVLTAFALMAALGPRPRVFGLRLATVIAMLVATLTSGLWIDRRIAALREAIAAPVSSLPSEDPRRITFGRLHGLSTLLMALTTVGGVLLLYLDARDSRT
jgi:hypothetical protein